MIIPNWMKKMFQTNNQVNVGYRLVWGYTIVSTDLKIIV